MKRSDVQLNQDGLKELLHYDPVTGLFTRNPAYRKFTTWEKVGSYDAHGRLVIKIMGKTYQSHRLAWLYMHGSFPKHHIDHINGNPKDNRIVNLREATDAQNIQNLRVARSDNETGLLGVSKDGNKFRSRIRINGKPVYLGSYSTADEAYQVYVQAKRLHHEFCTL